MIKSSYFVSDEDSYTIYTDPNNFISVKDELTNLTASSKLLYYVLLFIPYKNNWFFRNFLG